MNSWKIWLSFSILPIFVFWISPAWKEVKIEKKGVETLEILRDEKIKELQTLSEKKETLLDNDNQEILKKIPLTLEQENLIRDLTKISKETGFYFTSLSFGKGRNADVNAPQINLNFSVEGRLDKVQPFLSRIENNERFLGMNDLDLNIKDKNGLKIASFSVSLYAFAQE
ncbi:type 4a pilus biogenesis protein PilO [Candidatus Gracilibacteria bacterium]|nr:type 4a pilus biogenesis protein PilO [Candidatus Gracilibacteria bacterium]